MSKAESLAMLTAHGVDPFKVRGSGVPDVTSMDIAGSLRRLSKVEHEAVRVKYCQDNPRKLYAHALMEFKRYRDWELPDGETAKIAALVVQEFLSDNRCRSCNGVGQVGVHVCVDCSGSGVFYLDTGEFQEYVDEGSRWLNMVLSNALGKIESVVDEPV